jgi:hypothetical protein
MTFAAFLMSDASANLSKLPEATAHTRQAM